MDKSWADVISDLQIRGMTYAQIGEAIGCAASTVGDLASGRSQSPRAAAAFALLKLHSHRLGCALTPSTAPVAQIRQLVDSRLSKRALRQKFGFKTDAHLAKVLGVGVQVIEAWGEGENVPATLAPAVMKLLGHEEQPAQQRRPQDPDADRIVNLEVA